MAFFSTNCGAAVSLKAKTLAIEYRVYGQHVDLIPQYATELVMARSMSSQLLATKLFARSAGDENHYNRCDSGRYAGVRTGDLTGAAGGQYSGVSILAFDAEGKRQDILIEAVPGLRLMAILTDVKYTKFAKLEALQEAARATLKIVELLTAQSYLDGSVGFGVRTN
jgi:putative ABC transport system substrate-binding protein